MTKPGGRPRVSEPSALSLFSYGFRPFFLGAAVWAIVALALWIGALTGIWQLAPGYGALAWHAHEMLVGYGSAVVAGFLLTAVPNWTGRLPIAGWRLALLFMIWGLARLSFLAIGTLGPLPGAAIDSVFLPCVLIVMAREVMIGRNWRNLAPLAIVGLLAAANIIFHAEVLVTGAASIGFRAGVAALIALIVLIGGRITPSFTHNWLVRENPGRLPVPFDRFDGVVVITSTLALALWTCIPQSYPSAALLALAAILQAVRLLRWAGIRAMREPLVLIQHIGYGFVPLGFALAALASAGVVPATTAIHAWTVGAFGTMTLAVMTRATLGHTGRSLSASPATQLIYAAVLLAAAARIWAALQPASMEVLLHVAAFAWAAAFLGFGIIYGPMLCQQRIREAQ